MKPRLGEVFSFQSGEFLFQPPRQKCIPSKIQIPMGYTLNLDCMKRKWACEEKVIELLRFFGMAWTPKNLLGHGFGGHPLRQFNP
jgi:hypothetical protein